MRRTRPTRLVILLGAVLCLTAVAVAAPPAEHVQKARKASPKRGVAMPVGLVRAAKHPPLTPKAQRALPKVARARLAALPAGAPPVLLPESKRLLETAQVVTGKRWYTVSMQAADYSVYVAGTSVAVVAPTMDVPPRAKAKEWVPRISRTHGIVTVSFPAWGAAYDVDVECLGGEAHPMCGDDVMVLALVDTLRRLK